MAGSTTTCHGSKPSAETQPVPLDILEAWCSGLRPAPQLTVSEWAEEHRRLGKKTSSEAGPWRNSRTPYLAEIMDALSVYHPAREVWFQKGSQVGGSEVGNNWLGYVIHHAPGPTIVVYPRVDDSKNTSKLRVDSLIDETPALRELIPPARSRDSGNTTLVKEFPGGVLKLVGANSAAGLKSMAARNVYCDEVDEFPDDVQGQGDPINLVLVRSRTFPNRKGFFVSSPTIKGSSRIEQGFEATDKRRFFVPCPHCGAYQVLTWSGVQWAKRPDGRPDLDSVAYLCDSCDTPIQEHHKTEMLAAGEWRATAIPKDPLVIGFHLSALYSPVGWFSWREAVQMFVDATEKQRNGDPAPMKVFVNTVLGETTEPQSTDIDQDSLRQRAESLIVIPEGGLMLSAGVDTQDNRLAVLIAAWGRGEEAWLLHYDELHGDPDRPEVWEKLGAVIFRPWRHESGVDLHVTSVAVDSGGHKTQAVYAYARQHAPLVMAIKGMGEEPGRGGTSRPILGHPTQQDLDFGGQKIPDGVQLWPVGTNTGYGLMTARLQKLDAGPGFIHVPAGQDDEFFRQLASMREVTTWKKGIQKREWVQVHRRREVLHCLIYAYAAAIRGGLARADWAELERAIHRPAQALAERPRAVRSSFLSA